MVIARNLFPILLYLRSLFESISPSLGWNLGSNLGHFRFYQD